MPQVSRHDVTAGRTHHDAVDLLLEEVVDVEEVSPPQVRTRIVIGVHVRLEWTLSDVRHQCGIHQHHESVRRRQSKVSPIFFKGMQS